MLYDGCRSMSDWGFLDRQQVPQYGMILVYKENSNYMFVHSMKLCASYKVCCRLPLRPSTSKRDEAGKRSSVFTPNSTAMTTDLSKTELKSQLTWFFQNPYIKSLLAYIQKPTTPNTSKFTCACVPSQQCTDEGLLLARAATGGFGIMKPRFGIIQSRSANVHPRFVFNVWLIHKSETNILHLNIWQIISIPVAVLHV